MKARRRFITRDSGLAISVEQLQPVTDTSERPNDQSITSRKSSISSDVSNYLTTDEIPWTDSSDTTTSSHRKGNMHQHISSVTSLSSSSRTDSCFQPIHHRGSTASESSSMAGLFSSTGESTPVSQRRHVIKPPPTTNNSQSATSFLSTVEMSQLDFAINQLSAMTMTSSTATVPSKSSSAAPTVGRTHLISSSSSSSKRVWQPNSDHSPSSSVPPVLVDLDLGYHRVHSLQQSTVDGLIIQPRTVVRTTPTSANYRSVSAPTGNNKLVLSPTSAFMDVTTNSGQNLEDFEAMLNGPQDDRNSSPRQGFNSVKRMAMLFEEPSKQKTDSADKLPPSGDVRSVHSSNRTKQSRMNSVVKGGASATLDSELTVNAELFFFPSVPESTTSGKPLPSPTVTRRVASTNQSTTMSRGQPVRLQPNNLTVRKSYNDLTSSTLKNALHYNASDEHLRQSVMSSLSGVCLSQTSLVLSSKTELPRDHQNDVTATQSPSSNLASTPGRNLVGSSPHKVKNNNESTKQSADTRRAAADVRVDSIDIAMSALETAISMLGASTASQLKSDLSQQKEADRNSRCLKTRMSPEVSNKSPIRNKSGTTENANLQTTLRLLDKTIVEIDSAISITDLAHDGTKLVGHSVPPSSLNAVEKSSTLNELQVFGGNFRLNKPLNRASAFTAIEQRESQQSADQVKSLTSVNLVVLQDKFRNISSNESTASNVTPWRTVNGLRPIDRNSGDFRTAVIVDKKSTGSVRCIDDRKENDAVSDIWRAVEKHSYSMVRQLESTPLAASNSGVASYKTDDSQRQQRGLLMREDSFNRPDSPLFYETLPLPVESAIRRHRQNRDKHKDGGSDHSNRCKQTRRQSSSSESDGAKQAKGQDQHVQGKGRHRTLRHKPAKQRSASAGARLQGRSPQRSRRPDNRRAGEGSDDGMQTGGSVSLDSEVDDVIENRLVTAQKNSLATNQLTSPRQCEQEQQQPATTNSSTSQRQGAVADDEPKTSSSSSSPRKTFDNHDDSFVTVTDKTDAKCDDVTLNDNDSAISSIPGGPASDRVTAPSTSGIDERAETEDEDDNGDHSNRQENDVFRHERVDEVKEELMISEQQTMCDDVFEVQSNVDDVVVDIPQSAAVCSLHQHLSLNEHIFVIPVSPATIVCHVLPTTVTEPELLAAEKLVCDVITNPLGSLTTQMPTSNSPPLENGHSSSSRSSSSSSSADTNHSSDEIIRTVVATVTTPEIATVCLSVRELKPVVCVEPDIPECVLVPVVSVSQGPVTRSLCATSSPTVTSATGRNTLTTVTRPTNNQLSTSYSKLRDLDAAQIGLSQLSSAVTSQVKSSASRPMSGDRVTPNVASRTSVNVTTPIVNARPKTSSDCNSSGVMKARTKVVNLDSCLTINKPPTARLYDTNTAPVAAEWKTEPRSKFNASNYSTDKERHSNSLAELEKIAAQTRLISDSLGTGQQVSKPTEKPFSTLRSTSASRQQAASNVVSTSGTQFGVSRSSNGPTFSSARVVGSSGNAGSGIVRKQLVQLDSVLHPVVTCSANTGTSWLSTASSAAKRVVRKSQTADLTTIGLRAAAAAAAAGGGVNSSSNPLPKLASTKSASEYEDAFRVDSRNIQPNRTKATVPATTSLMSSSRAVVSQPRPLSQNLSHILSRQPTTTSTSTSSAVFPSRPSPQLPRRQQPLIGSRSSSLYTNPTSNTTTGTLQNRLTSSLANTRHSAGPLIRRENSDDDIDRLVEINARHVIGRTTNTGSSVAAPIKHSLR